MRRWFFFFLALLAPVPAVADEMSMIISVVSGSWVSGSMTDESGNRVCLGVSAPTLAFRASPQGIEVWVINEAWSMSADVSGDVTFKVGDFSTVLPMSAMSATVLTGTVQPADLTGLLDAMDKAPMAKITVGKAKALTVSLSGSTRALNDFRTCSTVRGYGDLGGKAVAGGNPFL